MIQLLFLLICVFGIPQIKPLWRWMDSFAFGRATLVKEYFIVMSFIAGSRFIWYFATTMTGSSDPTVPFVLHLGLLPNAFREFPFTFLLPATALPLEAWLLGTVIGFGSLVYGTLGLPSEGLNRAVNVPDKIRVSMFYFGFHFLWLMTAVMRLPV